VIFQHARPSDAGPIAALHAESWRSAYRGLVPDDVLGAGLDADRLPAWRDRSASVDPERRFVLGAASVGGLVGFTCLLEDGEARFGPLLDNLHVKPGWRGHGIGARLLQASRKWVQQVAPGQPMHFWVIEGNTAARAFYQAQGSREGSARSTRWGGFR
jgi:GNAT superfamily N-acetyltransferase